MAIPVIEPRSLRQLQRDSQQLRYLVQSELARLRGFVNELLDEGEGGGGNDRLAITTVQIPARVGLTPGGPVSVQPLKRDGTTGDLVFDGQPVDVYSWVQTPSSDPADQPGGNLFIWIEESAGDDLMWFTGQDCEPPPPAYEQIESGETIGDNDVGVVYV